MFEEGNQYAFEDQVQEQSVSQGMVIWYSFLDSAARRLGRFGKNSGEVDWEYVSMETQADFLISSGALGLSREGSF